MSPALWAPVQMTAPWAMLPTQYIASGYANHYVNQYTTGDATAYVNPYAPRRPSEFYSGHSSSHPGALDGLLLGGAHVAFATRMTGPGICMTVYANLRAVNAALGTCIHRSSTSSEKPSPPCRIIVCTRLLYPVIMLAGRIRPQHRRPSTCCGVDGGRLVHRSGTNEFSAAEGLGLYRRLRRLASPVCQASPLRRLTSGRACFADCRRYASAVFPQCTSAGVEHAETEAA